MRLPAILIFFVIVFSPFLASTQTYLGLKAGLLTTPIISYNESARETKSIDFHNSFTLGLTFNKMANKVFSIGTNLNYDHYKVDYYSSWSGAAGGYQRVDGTLTVGIVAVYLYPQFNFGKRVQFYFNFGPYIGFVAHSGFQGSTEKLNGEETNNINNSGLDYLNTLRIAFKQTLGVSYRIRDRWYIFVESEFGLGPTLISDGGQQLDVKIIIGCTFKINNNPIKPPENATH